MTYKCIFINANSLVSRCKRHYMQMFLDRHKPDVLLVAEHKLTSRNRICFKGYRSFIGNRTGGGGGGTAIFMREGIRGERISADLGRIENTVVRVSTVNGRGFIIASLYLRPLDTLRMAELEALKGLIGADEAIIGADLNARHVQWGDHTDNGSGRTLARWLERETILVLRRTAGPTRIAAQSRSYIDFFLTTVGIVRTEIERSEGGLRTLDFESDHMAVQLDAEMETLATRTPTEMYDYTTIRTQAFNARLAAELATCALPDDRNVNTEEIDAAVEGVTVAFKSAMEESIRKFKPRNGLMRELPGDILNLISQKKTLRRRMHRLVDVQEAMTIRAVVRNLDTIIRERIKLFEDDLFVRQLNGIKPDNNMYRKIHAFTGSRRRKEIGQLVDDTGRTILADMEKAETLAETFSRIQGNSGLRDDDGVTREEIYRPMTTFGDSHLANGNMLPGASPLPMRLVKPGDIGAVLRRLNNKKSSGEDEIPNYVLRRAGERSWRHLATLFNHCLNLGYFPEKWKRSRVIPILKPGKDPTRPEGYRPISLLSNLGKMFEIFVLERINEHIEDKEILSHAQFGFRRGLSTGHALMSLVDKISRGLNRKRATVAVSLDFEKAFDTVWQEGILQKMEGTHGFNPCLSRLTRDYLRSRSFTVEIGETRSADRDVKAGVPQGSVLGPVLYNLYLADLPRPESDETVIIYADDIIVAATNARAKTAEKNLTRYLERLGEYFTQWRLRLNVPKCQAIIFKGKRGSVYRNARSYVPRITINGETIGSTSTIKYLGIMFQEDMSFIKHVDYVLRKGWAALANFRGLLSKRGGLSRKVKTALYRQVIRPTMTYGFPAWYTISSHQMERIRVLERKMLAYCLEIKGRLDITGSYKRPSCREIYREGGLPRIDVFMFGSAVSHLSKCQGHVNDLVRNCELAAEELQNILDNRGHLTPMCMLGLIEKGLAFDREDRLLFYHRRYGEYGLDNMVYNTAQ